MLYDFFCWEYTFPLTCGLASGASGHCLLSNHVLILKLISQCQTAVWWLLAEIILSVGPRVWIQKRGSNAHTNAVSLAVTIPRMHLLLCTFFRMQAKGEKPLDVGINVISLHSCIIPFQMSLFDMRTSAKRMKTVHEDVSTASWNTDEVCSIPCLIL